MRFRTFFLLCLPVAVALAQKTAPPSPSGLHCKPHHRRQKLLTLRLKDPAPESLGSGIRLKSSFDVKIGSSVVRVVVRDSEGQMIATGNAAIEIQ
ncbi:MAG TPA: hypothetical protein VMT86_16370 [Bryobacteraceae bacterium]|nr:hypothetical protein [Bryobacteraceae bacterium]